MKAKDLAKILLQTPECEVTTPVYIGCDTPLLIITTVKHLSKGENVGRDGASRKLVDKNNIAKVDFLILGTMEL